MHDRRSFLKVGAGAACLALAGRDWLPAEARALLPRTANDPDSARRCFDLLRRAGAGEYGSVGVWEYGSMGV